MIHISVLSKNRYDSNTKEILGCTILIKDISCKGEWVLGTVYHLWGNFIGVHVGSVGLPGYLSVCRELPGLVGLCRAVGLCWTVGLSGLCRTVGLELDMT